MKTKSNKAQKRHIFKGGKQRFANTKFCVSKNEGFWKFLERNQTPFDLIQFSKTLEFPKTTKFTRFKIIPSKLKDFDVFWGEIRPILDFTQFLKTFKCPKMTRFQGWKIVYGKLKMICIQNEGFSTFSEAKKDPPLSGYEFCSKCHHDLSFPEIRRKTLMSQKKRCKTTDFRRMRVAKIANSEMRCKLLFWKVCIKISYKPLWIFYLICPQNVLQNRESECFFSQNSHLWVSEISKIAIISTNMWVMNMVAKDDL